jgi:hypothetical protein
MSDYLILYFKKWGAINKRTGHGKAGLPCIYCMFGMLVGSIIYNHKLIANHLITTNFWNELSPFLYNICPVSGSA